MAVNQKAVEAVVSALKVNGRLSGPELLTVLRTLKNASLYLEVRAKPALDYKTRKGLLSHWSPKIAKAICLSIYPDFKGTYEQHLWLLTHKAAETEPTSSIYCPGGGYSTYAKEARDKGVLFLWPYERIDDTRLCGPSHYLYYILRWERPQVDAILAGPSRFSSRLDKKYLAKALSLHSFYKSLPYVPETRNERQKALNAAVKAETRCSGQSQIKFKIIAYGWKHHSQYLGPEEVLCSL
jgi:hypothetical protein